ncbi:MAG: Trm112 family protein [Aeromicrobium sp.]|uniref:Trm112 family protein n=1 Tax=Aeromicrobium sp. TaxID=1871063 RepID=UPI0039E724F0
MVIDPILVETLVCPQCRDRPFVDVDAYELVCQNCQLAYPVVEEIPVMLAREARAL